MPRPSFARRFILPAAALFALAGTPARAAVSITTVGTYDENGTATNTVDTSATAAPNDVASFKSAVATAYGVNLGGVINFDVAANATDTVLNAAYGTAATKTLTVAASKTLSLQTVTSSSAISGNANGSRVALLSANTTGATGNDFTLTFGAITGGNANEGVTQVGLTALSRNTAGYPLTLTVTATLSDGSVQTSTFNLASSFGGNDTFVGFTAPANTGITSLSFDLPADGTSQDTRLIFDDLGFITGTVSNVPEPAGLAVAVLPAIAGLVRRRRR